MHVGVLIPVIKAKNIEEGRIIAQGILWTDDWCWNEDEELNMNAVWDYPYDIKDRWYDGTDKNTILYPGTTVADFKEKYVYTGFISEQNILDLFEFVYNIDDGTMDYTDPEQTLEYIMSLPDDTLLYVGAVHI